METIDSIDLRELAERFGREGHFVIPSFVGREECLRMDADVEKYRNESVLIDVQVRQLHRKLEFMTFHGSAVDENVLGVSEISKKIENLVNAISAVRYVELDNRDIGVSVNITKPGGVFTWHYLISTKPQS